jgi:hypothetical protein
MYAQRGVIILGIQDSVKDVLHGRCHVNMFHRSVLKKENVHFYDKRERNTYTHTICGNDCHIF